MQNKYMRYILFAALTFLLFPSCEGNDPSVNAGRLRVKLTDAADVTIKELYLDIREMAVYATDTASMEGEWVTLEYNGGEYNLLKLMNGKSVQLSDQYFPAGKAIRKVRVVLGNNNRIFTFTGGPYPLQLPSEIINEMVVDMIEPVVVMPSIISGIVIDVNAAMSVWESNGNYFLYPSARAFPETYGSSLRGYVSPVEATEFIAIVQDYDTLLTLPEADGMFLFPGLKKGIWEVHLITRPTTNYLDTVFTWEIEATGIVDITPKPISLPYAVP